MIPTPFLKKIYIVCLLFIAYFSMAASYGTAQFELDTHAQLTRVCFIDSFEVLSETRVLLVCVL